MAYKYLKKGSRFKRRKFKPRGPTGIVRYAKMAQQAWRGMKYIKSLINVEKKFFDVTYGQTGIDYSGAIIPLSQIAEGNDYNQRDGNSILCQSIQFRAELKANPTSAVNALRVMVIADNDNTGSTPAVSDILESTGSILSVVTPMKHTVGKRFSVLYDKVLSLSNTGNSWITMIKKFMKYHSHIRFTNTGATNTSEGSLYAVFLSDVNSNTPSLVWYSRLRYTDN